MFRQRERRDDPELVCSESEPLVDVAESPVAGDDLPVARNQSQSQSGDRSKRRSEDPCEHRSEPPRHWKLARATRAAAIGGTFLAASAFVLYIDAKFHPLSGMHAFLMAVACFQLVCLVLLGIHLAAPRWYRAIPSAPVSNRKFRILRGLWLAPLCWLLVTFLAAIPLDEAVRNRKLLPTPLIRASAFMEALVSRRYAAGKVATMRDIAFRKGDFATARRLHGMALFWARRMKVSEQEVGDPILYQALQRDRRAMSAFALAKYRAPGLSYLQFESMMAAVTLDRHGHSDAADVIYERAQKQLPEGTTLGSLGFPLPISEERLAMLMEDESLTQFGDNRQSVRSFLVQPGSKTAFGTTLLDLTNRIFDLRPQDRRHDVPVIMSAYGMSTMLDRVESNDLRSHFAWAEPIWNSDKFIWNPTVVNLGVLVSPEPQPMPVSTDGKIPLPAAHPMMAGLPLWALRMEQYVILTQEQANQVDSVEHDMRIHKKY